MMGENTKVETLNLALENLAAAGTEFLFFTLNPRLEV